MLPDAHPEGMRGILLAAACLLAGCASPEPPAPQGPLLQVLGNVGTSGETLPASVGEGIPAPAVSVAWEGAEVAASEGEGVSLSLGESGARLRFVNHGEWVRTSLRWEDEGCRVTLRAVNGDFARPDGRIPLDHAMDADAPYQDYTFTGACEGRLFVLWRG